MKQLYRCVDCGLERWRRPDGAGERCRSCAMRITQRLRVRPNHGITDKIRSGNGQGWLYPEACSGCGTVRYMALGEVGTGKVCRNCQGAKIAASKIKHGLSDSRLDRAYRSMMYRCGHTESDLDERSKRNYAGRGIRVCKEWRDSRATFFLWALSNGYRDNLTIERRDVNGNYEPTNCCWISSEQQAHNRRTSRLTKDDVIAIRERLLQGEKAGPIAEKYGVSYALIAMVKAERSWKGIGPSTKHLIDPGWRTRKHSNQAADQSAG